MRFLHACLLTLVALGSGADALAAPEKWQGTPLSKFLDELNAQGLQVVYSSDLVDAGLIIATEPDLTDLRSTLVSVLAPFGLGVTAGPGQSLLVVRKPAAAPTASVQQLPAEEPPLPEIIVTSGLHRLENSETGAHTYLDRELTTRIPAFGEDVVRVTNRIPGTANGGVSARNHVRGGEANEVLFLLDGLRLYEPYHLKDFQTIATIISSSTTAGIDFYTGNYPARYGDRMSGVMSLDLRQPAKAVETELALSLFNASALSLGVFGDEEQGDWLVAARRGNLDVVVDLVDPAYGSPRYHDLLVHGGWSFGPRSTWSANYLASNDSLLLNDPTRRETASASYSNEVFWLKWEAEWSPVLASETLLSHTAIANRRSGSVDLPGIVSGSLKDESDYRVSAITQNWLVTPAEDLNFRLGFDVKHLDGLFRFNSDRSITPPFDSVFENEQTTMRDFDLESDGDMYAAYLEARWALHPDLVVEAGIRRDIQSYTIAGRDEQTSPRINLLYRFGEHTELRAGWGQFSQAQEVNELQVSDGVADYYPAQRAEHTVLNVKHHLSNGVELDLSAYRKAFRQLRPRYENAFNALTLVPELQFDRVRIDAGSAESRGVELLVSRESSERRVIWWFGYAWSSTEDSTAAGTLPRSWNQTHSAKAGLSWRWSRWNLSAAAEGHTGWPRTELRARQLPGDDGADQLTLETTPLYSLRHANFHTLDVRISRDFDVTRGQLQVFLEATNLYNQANSCCIEYSLDTSTESPQLRSKQTDWLPVVPSLGIVWTF